MLVKISSPKPMPLIFAKTGEYIAKDGELCRESIPVNKLSDDDLFAARHFFLPLGLVIIRLSYLDKPSTRTWFIW